MRKGNYSSIGGPFNCEWVGCKFHCQGHSFLLELLPIVSGHSGSEIVEPSEETFPLMIMDACWGPYKVTRRLLHHWHELIVVACLLVRVSGSLLGSADGKWRSQWCKLFRCSFPWVAWAALVTSLFIRVFVWFMVCGCCSSAKHRSTFGLLEYLLSLLVVWLEEAVAFIFPFLQSC